MKKILIKVFSVIGLHHIAQNACLKWRFICHRMIRGGWHRHHIVANYLKQHTVTKINFSSGERRLDGWLNSDIYTGDIYINALGSLPFPSNSFSYIYSHHFIEHISISQFQRLLSEFHRILKPSGKIRLVTPDLDKILDSYHEADPTMVKFYTNLLPISNSCSMFNILIFNNSEHQFVYNADTLISMLTSSGFTRIQEWPYNVSNNPVFNRMDNHGYQHIHSISLCVEAEKANFQEPLIPF